MWVFLGLVVLFLSIVRWCWVVSVRGCWWSWGVGAWGVRRRVWWRVVWLWSRGLVVWRFCLRVRVLSVWVWVGSFMVRSRFSGVRWMRCVRSLMGIWGVRCLMCSSGMTVIVVVVGVGVFWWWWVFVWGVWGFVA